ncbi:hypothetical protein [Rummeliibacillus stabekisii]|uniref:hypothetical protein n=1 Tax=Rummeliibacillus stabekisii TaxID=241244 RepID=UPI00116F24F1|nr:hypothetical protein [Rummeliibacillus stabekisii]MBB5169185.1 hypothetical protein [Rummeliibacillus stabekisii]GEL03445.1 hypothetical protein RST01_00720 [Rummeliibacillus stabekisii]
MIFKIILGLIGLFIIYGGFKYSKATQDKYLKKTMNDLGDATSNPGFGDVGIISFIIYFILDFILEKSPWYIVKILNLLLGILIFITAVIVPY